VVIHLRSADELIANIVRQLGFVSDVKVVDNKLVVQLDDPDIHNPDLIRTLVNAQADIKFIGELRYSLEEVYLQLVRNA